MKKLMLCALFMTAISLTTTAAAQEPQKQCPTTGQCCQKVKANCPKECPADKKQCCAENGECPKNCAAVCENPKPCCQKTTTESKPCKQSCNKPCKKACKTN